MAKLADASDLGSDAARHGGSSPSIRTKQPCLRQLRRGFFIILKHQSIIKGFYGQYRA